MDDLIDKNLHSKKVTKMRLIEHTSLPAGPIGEGGGVDGALRSAAFWPIMVIVKTETIFNHPNRYGIDIGHGTGAAMFGHFNFGLGINMVGVESNEYRCDHSWKFHGILSVHADNELRRICQMSILFQGNATDILPRELGEKPLLAFLVYWFRQGWSEEDICNMISFLNTFFNLEWLITDMSAKTLLKYGFSGTFLGCSRQFSGGMVQSTCSRTLFVHHLQPRMASLPDKEFVCSIEESSIVGTFQTTGPVKFSERQSKAMQKLREETKKTRKFRKNIAKAHSSVCAKFEMRPLRKFLTAARISYLRRNPFVLNRSHTTLVEQNTQGSMRPMGAKHHQAFLKDDRRQAESSHKTLWGKCMSFLFSKLSVH